MSQLFPRGALILRRFFSTSSGLGPRYSLIVDRLKSALDPTHLEVQNESHMHSVPKNSETHFRVVVVSEKFNQMKQVARHRTINQLFRDEFQSGLHALALLPYTPQEWEALQANQDQPPKSPACMGGSKHDKKNPTTE